MGYSRCPCLIPRTTQHLCPIEPLISVTVSINLSRNGGGKSHCHLLLPGCEDDEMLKPACERKSIGHWWLISRDDDVRWPHLPVLRSCRVCLLGRFWLFGVILTDPADLIGFLKDCHLWRPFQSFSHQLSGVYPCHHTGSSPHLLLASCLWHHPILLKSWLIPASFRKNSWCISL